MLIGIEVVGTISTMAPEVFTKQYTETLGRSCDVSSAEVTTKNVGLVRYVFFFQGNL